MIVASRLILLLANLPLFHQADNRELLTAFIIGFRFDLAAALITITPPLLLLWLPAPWRLRLVLMTVCKWLTLIVLCIAAGFLWGDLLFFVEANRHITLEPTAILTDWSSMFRMLLRHYLWAAALLVIFWAGLGWWVFRVFKRAKSADAELDGWGWARAAFFLPVALITFIGIRGGVQKEPLKFADAIVGNNPFVASAAMNGWYSYLTETTKVKRPVSLISASEALTLTRSLVSRPDDRFLEEPPSPDSTGDAAFTYKSFHPLLRISPSTGSIVSEGEKLNLVLLVVESLNAAYLRSFGGAESVMPFLDSLAASSVCFTSCQSVGTRSFRGLSAILASYPNLSPDSYQLTILLPRLTGLGQLLSKQGYSTGFIHGAPLNSMGVTAIAKMTGYKRFLSQNDFPDSADNGSWGVWDHLALRRLSDALDESPEPVHYALFTLCTHSPWSLPKTFNPPFQRQRPKAMILNTYAYLDEALRDYFHYESLQPRFTRTVYVIIGDHTSHASELERFHIGCIFYAPGRLTPRFDDRLCSQFDILPSLLDLMGFEVPHSSFGSSLFTQPNRVQWTIMLQANILYWQEGTRILASELTHRLTLYNPSDTSPNPQDYLTAELELADLLTHRLEAVYQTAEMLARDNLFAPAESDAPSTASR